MLLFQIFEKEKAEVAKFLVNSSIVPKLNYKLLTKKKRIMFTKPSPKPRCHPTMSVLHRHPEAEKLFCSKIV